MSQEFEAIYENGVLRPLKPITLTEHALVSISIRPSGEADSNVVADRQRELLLAFTAKMETLEEPLPDTTVSNRDHDRILYGERG